MLGLSLVGSNGGGLRRKKTAADHRVGTEKGRTKRKKLAPASFHGGRRPAYGGRRTSPEGSEESVKWKGEGEGKQRR